MDLKAAVKITAGVTGQQEIDRLRSSVGGLQSIAKSAQSAFAVLGGTVALYQFAGFIKGAIDAADALNDLRQRTGIAVEDLDALGLAAEQNGSSLEAVSGSIQKLFRVMGSAAGGNAKAASDLKQFGISLDEVKRGSVSTTEALARIADRVASMPDGFQKAAALQSIFGKSAAEIVPLMNAGGDAIRGARDELEKYGALITGGQAAAADEFNDKLAVLSRVARGAGLQIANELLPAATDLLERLLEYSASGPGIAGTIQGIKTEFTDLASAILAVAGGLDRLAEYSAYLDKLANTYGPFSQNAQEGFFGVFPGKGSLPAGTVNRSLGKPNINATAGGLEEMLGSIGAPTAKPRTPFDFDFAAGEADKAGETALKRRGALLDQQTKKIADYTLAQRGAVELLKLEGERVNLSAREYEKLVAAKEHEIAVARETADMLPETATQYREVADAIFATRQAVEDFNFAQSRTFEAGAKTAFRDYIDAATDAAAQSEKLFSDAFKGTEDALVAFVKTGKLNVEDLFDSILENMARMLIQQQIMAPLMQGLGGIFGGGAPSAAPSTSGGLGGFLGDLVGSIFGFAGGGIMSKTGVGGVTSRPKISLFGEGDMAEAYVPLPDGRTIPVTMSAPMSPPVTVQTGKTEIVINNHGGSAPAVSETTDGRGNRRVEISIGEAVAGEVRRAGSPVNNAFRSTFAAAPALTGR